jgi:hypothetical protein
MAYILNISRKAGGTLQTTGCIPKNLTTKALVDVELAKSPDDISVVMDGVAPGASEAQIQGLLRYAQAIALGTNTSSVETAIAAII